jgi:guanylate kinase
MKKRLILLSGPSCVGKSPLTAAVKKFRPEVKFTKLAVIKSKQSRNLMPRPDEQDVWNNPNCWQTQEQIEALKNNDRYIVFNCYGFSQAVDLDMIVNSSEQTILMEMYYAIVPQILASQRLKNINIETVFLSPISKQEIEFFNSCRIDVDWAIKSLMAAKQYQRVIFHKRNIDRDFLQDIKTRIDDAVCELGSEKNFKHVIVNHDGEGSPNWNRLADGTFTGPPVGDAKLAVESLAKILSGNLL